MKVIIYDLLGKEVSTIFNQVLKEGDYTIKWDAKDLASGVYFYKLITPEFTETKSMLLVR